MSLVAVFVAVAALAACASGPHRTPPDATSVSFAVHGGTGALPRGAHTPEQEKALRDGLKAALEAGHNVIVRGGSCLDAVQAAVVKMEDDPTFNAGKGAVFDAAGGTSLDAAIMDGKDRSAGAVAAVRTVKNPIKAARFVKDASPNVLLVGKGADDFAAAHGLEIVTPDYFWTQQRWNDLQRAKHEAAAKSGPTDAPNGHGTVGAVCRDGSGNLAAATSTGGLTDKTVDRVGDSPIVGAGVFADNRTVAVSATGTGEVFIRGTAAATISDMIEFGGVPMTDAARRVVVERLLPLGGTGGVIALSPSGELAVPHTTPGLVYGFADGSGAITTRVFEGD